MSPSRAATASPTKSAGTRAPRGGSRTAGGGATAARSGRSRVVAPVRALEARVPFAALCSGIIVVTLLVVLGLNIQLSRGSYQAGDLRSRQSLLNEQEEALGEQLAALSAPGAVGAAALGLGMVQGEPAYLRLAGGDVIGDPEPAPAAGEDPDHAAAEAAEQGAPAGVPEPTAAPTEDPAADEPADDTSTADEPTDAESTP